MTAAPSVRGGRGMRGGGMMSSRQSVRPSSKDGFGGRGGGVASRSGRGIGLSGLSGRGGGGGTDLKPMGVGFNEALLNRRALIAVGPDDDDDDSDSDWDDEQGVVSRGCGKGEDVPFCFVCLCVSFVCFVCLCVCESFCLCVCVLFLCECLWCHPIYLCLQISRGHTRGKVMQDLFVFCFLLEVEGGGESGEGQGGAGRGGGLLVFRAWFGGFICVLTTLLYFR